MDRTVWNFSKREEEMFKALGLEEELSFSIKGLTTPFQVYQWAVNKCFLENIEGAAANSLRRCFVRFGSGTDARLTPEWDELILLTEEEEKEFS